MASLDDDGNSSLLYKIVVVGERGTGKTSIIRRYVHNIFLTGTKATIGVDFALKKLPNFDKSSKNITLQIWDIAGQERYGQMTRVYYQAAVGALVVYDVSRPSSQFEAVAEWKKDIDNKVFLPDGSNIPCVLIANKCDLPQNPQRTREEIDEFCKEHGFAGWFQTSSKENIGIESAFRFLVEKIQENDSNADEDADAADERPVFLSNQNGPTRKKWWSFC